jgi:hypothetical protein
MSTLDADDLVAIQAIVTNAIGVLLGARAITIHVHDGAGVSVSACLVSIFDSADTAHLGTVLTNASGNVIVNLADGTYKLRPLKSGYTFTTPQTLVVTADATAIIVATAWAPSAPSEPGVCVVYGYARSAAGEVLVGAEVKAFARTPITAGGYQLSNVIGRTTTNALGYFEIELIQGSAVTLGIASADLLIDRIVPSLASQDVTTWAA